ncbi:MAG: tetratricopeptide repeat protein [Deltaproteobacteria bacterium]|nr:tetratricopeptide repeat protein [Deltaproteobacteria bacterium]
MERETVAQIVGTLTRWASLGRFGTKTVRREVVKVIQGLLDEKTVRTGSHSQAKREVLRELGGYLGKRMGSGLAGLDQDDLLALSSLLSEAAVVRERQVEKDGRKALRVVVQARVSARGLNERLRVMAGDKRHLDRIKASEQRTGELLAEFGELEREGLRLASEGSAQEKKQFKTALKENVRHLEAQDWFQKMQVLWTGKAFSDAKLAIDYINQAIKLVPDHAVYHFFRGNANYYWKQHKLALRDYDEAIRLNKDYADAFNNRGNTFMAQGEHKKALKEYSHAISLDRKEAAFFNNLANAHYHLGDFPAALENYAAALKLEPSNALYHNNRGSARHSSGEAKKAIKDYTRALELDREFALAHFNRGISYHELGQFSEAMADYNNASRHDPRLAGAYYQRGRLLKQLGNEGAAQREWRKAAKMGHQQARQMLDGK